MLGGEGGSSVPYKALVMLMLLLCSCCLGGCWDQEEITSLAPISGLGMDAGEQPGMLRISVQITAPGGTAGGVGSSGEARLRVLSVEAETLAAGLIQLQGQLRRPPFMLHLSFVVLGEELAKSGIDGVLVSLQAAPQIRTSVPLMVAAGSAEEVLRAHSGIGRTPGQDITDLVENIANSPIGVRTTIIDAINTLSGIGSELALPILDLAPLSLQSAINLPDDGTGLSGGQYKEVKMERTALFQRNRWVATLDRLETNILTLLLGEGSRGIAVVPNPANPSQPLSGLYEGFTVSYESSVDGPNPPQVVIKPKVSIRLMEAFGGYDVAARGLEPIERAVEFDIQQEAQRLVDKLQQLGLDTLGLGQRIAGRHPREWSHLEPVWQDVYPQATVSTQAKAEVKVTGMLRRFHQTKR
jgi:spore germination protein KC